MDFGKKYYASLDIGTSSVGWAVLDEAGRLVKKRGRNLWGVRLFSEGETAEIRRGNRASRRRLKRRKERIRNLQEIFNKKIFKEDPNFFIRLNESYLQEDERSVKGISGLLNGSNISDRELKKEYKTIYHLRKYLLESNEKVDIRYIYLAMHHIIKYRGNFLYQGQEFSDINNQINEMIDSLKEEIQNLFGISMDIDTEFIIKVFKEKGISKSKKNEEILNVSKLNKGELKILKEIFNGILGLKMNINKLFDKEFIKEKLELSSSSAEEDFITIIEEAEEEENILIIIKSIYSWIQIQSIIKDEKYLSFAKVKQYDIYNKELKELKYLLKKYLEKEEYDKVLNSNDGIYEKYCRSVERKKIEAEEFYKQLKPFIDIIQKNIENKNEDFKVINTIIEFLEDKKKSKVFDEKTEILTELKRLVIEYLTQEDLNKILDIENELLINYKGIEKISKGEFYKKVKSFIANIRGVLEEKLSEKVNEYTILKSINKKIDENIYLIKTNIRENGEIPYQLGLMELQEIIKKQSKYYDFLEKEGEKIISLLKFKIPYYVGVLNPNSEFSWIEKREGYEKEKIYPWNFEEVVDIDRTAEGFIKRMTSDCSYLQGEEVVPDKSLIYEEYKFYNELNKLRINGEFLDISQKEKIKKELFEKKKKISKKDLEGYFGNNLMGEVKIEGLQGADKFVSTLEAKIDFKNIFGEITNENQEMIERIIYFITVFNEVEIIERSVKREFPELTEEAIKKILKLKYEAWGRLSRKLLVDIKGNERKSILQTLKTTDKNFMQIINDEKLGFDKKIEEYNREKNIEIKMDYESLIKPMQGSPAIKKGIWQSIRIVEEIKEIMKGEPSRIYIEVAKGDEEKKRTVTRVDKLIKIYEVLAEKNKEDKELLKILSAKDYKIDNEMLALYYSQKGKCMYSGRSLPLGELSNYCQVDHIIPKSILDDDSIENKVLVYSNENQRKASGKIANKTIDKMSSYWNHLYENGLIGSKKLRRLEDRRENFFEEEEQGFINRQLVETRQITKNIAALYSRMYRGTDTKVITIKASLVSGLRKMIGAHKLRELNDFHHAHDAYLVGVLGRYIGKRYKFEKEFIYDEYMLYKNKNEIRNQKNKYGFIISNMNYDFKKDGFEWNSKKEKSNIVKTLDYKDMYITKKVEIGKGSFYKITLNKKAQGDKKGIEIKRGLDIKKYGYYEGDEKAYYNVISYSKGKKIIKELVGIPIRIANLKDAKKEYGYLVEQGYSNITIIKRKIPKYQKIINDKGVFYLTSDTEWINAKELILNKKFIDSYVRARNGEVVEVHEMDEIFDELIGKIKVHYPIFEGISQKLENSRDKYRELKEKDKVLVIKEIMKILSVSAANGNLEKLGLNKRSGRLNSKRVDIEKTKFIMESITGFNSNEKEY
ncbi:MAG: type II CRISPR RNA-guided endonuclease Cas9 [Clostridium sp.]